MSLIYCCSECGRQYLESELYFNSVDIAQCKYCIGACIDFVVKRKEEPPQVCLACKNANGMKITGNISSPTTTLLVRCKLDNQYLIPKVECKDFL